VTRTHALEALAVALGQTASVSKSTVSRVCAQVLGELPQFRWPPCVRAPVQTV